MRRWVTGLGVSPVDAKFYYYTAKDGDGGGDRATADKVLRVFEKLPARVLTIVYVALHTEVFTEVEENAEGEVRAFLAADYVDKTTRGSVGVIYYDEIRSKLSSAFERGSSIMLITETCRSTNIICLPYKCQVRFIGGKPQLEWEEINFSNERTPPIFTKHEWESRPLTVQSTATEPEVSAACFSNGAVYTQALCDVMNPASRDHAVSFQDVMVNIQALMNDASRHPGLSSEPKPQVHVLYSSRKIENNESFWSAFQLKPLSPPARA